VLSVVQIYFETNATSSILAWQKPNEFECYMTFTPFVTKESAISASNRLVQWIKRQEENLFIVSAPTY